ncbi:MAG: hydroxymethylbilane synthase, partial [Chloroflexi bacterium]|nr:hydroxymethylbilane synthase [Chloroflexota bacterium]
MTVSTARTLRLALRGSPLSVAQSSQAIALLCEQRPAVLVEMIKVTTSGDRDRSTPLADIGSADGLFTRAVEAKLLEGRADFAIHSLKDLPTALDPRFVLAAIPPRAEPRDALLSPYPGGFDGLPRGARLGTSSPRRAAQALAQRPDLQVLSVRGNVGTRLRKLEEGQYDALVLAAAGLERLGLLGEAAELLPADRFIPAVGQGALAVECLAEDEATWSLLAAIDHQPSRLAVTAERAFLVGIGGGCRLPMAAHGQVRGDRLVLRGFVAQADGADAATDEVEGPA